MRNRLNLVAHMIVLPLLKKRNKNTASILWVNENQLCLFTHFIPHACEEIQN